MFNCVYRKKRKKEKEKETCPLILNKKFCLKNHLLFVVKSNFNNRQTCESNQFDPI